MLRLKELLVIHQLREQGESISEIARRTGLDRKTIRKGVDLELTSTIERN